MIVGICAGEKTTRETLHQICENVFIENDINGKVVEFETGENALDYPDELTFFLLGMEMPEMNGMSVMRKCRAMGKSMIIIYDAGCRGTMCGVPGMHVLGFVELENVAWELPVILGDVLVRAEHFTILEGGIDSREVLYIKAEPPYCRLFLQNGTSRSLRLSLTRLEDRLKEVDFVRVHRSYLVNLLYVENVWEDVVCMRKEKIPVAVRKRAVIRETFKRFYEEAGMRRHRAQHRQSGMHPGMQ